MILSRYIFTQHCELPPIAKMYQLEINDSQPVHFCPQLRKCTSWELKFLSRYIFAQDWDNLQAGSTKRYWLGIFLNWYIFAQNCENGRQLTILSRYIFAQHSENVPARN